MVKMDIKHVTMVWAGKPRPDSGLSRNGDTDNRRRAVTPGLIIPRPLVRRPSLDNSTTKYKQVTQSHVLPAKRESSSSHIIHSHNKTNENLDRGSYQRRTIGSVPPSALSLSTISAKPAQITTTQHVTPHRQVTTSTSISPAATRTSSTTELKPRTSPTTELKPILKTRKGTYDSQSSSPKSEDESRAARTSKLAANLDSKFCYRLPDKPSAVNGKKSVSFKEDDRPTTYARRHYTSSVMKTVPYSALRSTGDTQPRQIFV